MATAKITIETIADNKQLQDLNKTLHEGTKHLKEMQAQYKQWTKEGNHTAEEMANLNAKIAAQKALNQKATKDIRNLSNELANAGDKAKGLKEQLGNMINSKLGVDIGSITSAMTSSTAVIGGMITAVGAVGAKLSEAGREMSAYSNQFISYAKNMKSATEMYNLFNEVARNMNSSYNEQQIYDMAKGFMNVGISAKESADLITKCTDAAAQMGEGAEFADILGDAFKRLAVGGELTEKQYKALAEAGIDLTDVQDEMRKGGVAAYEALKKKLSEYEGGMASTKTTSEEMKADCVANIAEIARQTAYLVDDFFGFSESLKTFYQWVIDTTGKVIEGIKRMRDALRENVAAADEYARAAKEWEEIYGKTFQGTDTERDAAIAAYANACADIVKEKTAEAIQDEKLLALEAKRNQVKTIAGGGKTSGGGTAKAEKAVDPEAEARKALEEELRNAQTLHNLKMGLYAQEEEAKMISAESNRARMVEELANYQQFLQDKLALDTLSTEQRIQLETQLAKTIAELQKKPTETVKEEQSKLKGIYDQTARSFASAMTDCITGAKSFGEAFKGIIKQIIQQLMQAALYAAIVASFTGGAGTNWGSRFSGAFKGGLGLAGGGMVYGPGTSTSDSIPAMLSNGEAVLNAEAVRSIGGASTVNALNAGFNPAAESERYGNSSITLNVSAMDADSFGDFLGRGGLNTIKEAMFADDLRFAGGVV